MLRKKKRLAHCYSKANLVPLSLVSIFAHQVLLFLLFLQGAPAADRLAPSKQGRLPSFSASFTCDSCMGDALRCCATSQVSMSAHLWKGLWPLHDLYDSQLHACACATRAGDWTRGFASALVGATTIHAPLFPLFTGENLYSSLTNQTNKLPSTSIYLSCSPLPESNRSRYPEASTEHPLLRRDIADFMDDQLVIARSDGVVEGLRNPRADLMALFHVILALGREAVDVYHGQLRAGVWFEERFVAVV